MQHRHVVGRTLLEIPAGHIDPGEEPDAAGRRELLEETGYAGENWHDLGALFSGASRLTSQFRSFLALDARKVTEPALAEAETIRIHELPWNKFVGGLLKQPLMDASQMATLLLLFLYVGSSNNPDIFAPEAALMSRARAVTAVLPSDLAPAPGKAWVTPAASPIIPRHRARWSDGVRRSDPHPARELLSAW
jgi:8-oxo-dGTP pyrophosphatase MutT (NUDIX family)